MYSLVFFINSKTISIVEVGDLCPEKAEGEITSVKYGKSKYKAKIVKKSEDKGYLNSLKVTKEGEILVKNTSSKLAQSLKEKLKRKGKAVSQKRVDNLTSQSEKLLRMKNIFEDSDSKESESEAESPRSENSAEESDDEPPEIKIKKLKAKIREMERSQKRTSAARENSPSPSCSKWNDRPMASQQDNDNPDFQLAENHDNAVFQCTQPQNEETVNVPDNPDLQLAENHDNAVFQRTQHQNEEALNVPPAAILNPTAGQNEIDEAYLNLCTQPGEGRSRLCPNYNVWIDKGDLTYMQRWTKQPKEMTRQLLKNLVGVNNLKRMCARGRSKNNRRSIPVEIMNCVEYYVNKKCETRLTPAEFTDVVNLLIGTLRNPKR